MISISIISPLKSMAVIDKAIEHNDFGCVFHRYVYENLEEIKDIYEQCKDISDVLFFSGELGYSYILTHVDDLKVPCTFISYTEKTLLSILLNFVIHYPDVPLNRLYIDFLTPVNDFMNLKKYLDPEHMPYCFENPVYNYETLKERAVKLWESKKIDMMFTRTTNQLEVLNKLQIPYIHFLPTEEMVRDSIRHAINSIRLKQKNQLNKLVILIKLVYPDNISSQDREYLEITLHKYLLDFRKEYAYDFSLHAVSNRFELDLDSDLYKSSFSRIQDLIAFLDQKGDLEFRLGAVAAARRADVLDAHRLCNDVAYAHAPVQARAGVLKDDLPLRLQHAAVRAEDAAVADIDAAIQDLPALRPQQIHHAARDGRFAGAGFADQAENLAAPERERDVIHSAEHGPSPEREGVRQTAHLEKRLSHGARLRSAA